MCPNHKCEYGKCRSRTLSPLVLGILYCLKDRNYFACFTQTHELRYGSFRSAIELRSDLSRCNEGLYDDLVAFCRELYVAAISKLYQEGTI